MVTLTKSLIRGGRNLLEPYCRVIIGDDQFVIGDGKLLSCSVTISEGKNTSSCRISLFDPKKLYTDKYFTVIPEDGLQPLVIPEKKSRGGGRGSIDTSKAAYNSSSYTQNGELSANMRAMLDTISWAEGTTGGYNIQFTGTTFEGYSDHPRQVRCSNGLCSDAAGRYQFLSTTWDGVGLGDFSPENQDLGAVRLIEGRGALQAVEEGRIQDALEGTGGNTGLAYEWASLPPYRYSGQGTRSMSEVLTYWEERKRFYEDQGSVPREEAQQSVQEAATPEKTEAKPSATLAGQQITVEFGYEGQGIVAYSFLHTGLEFSLFDVTELVFIGQAASWVMGQRSKSTVYQNLTLKQIATRICQQYGLNLEMPLDGPKYEFFPQYGRSDYDTLHNECRRIGYRFFCEGNTVHIEPRQIQDSGFVLRYGTNLSTQFRVKHQAQSSFSSGGARASVPSDKTSTGEIKYYLDIETGEIVQDQKEDDKGTGAAEKPVATAGSTGSHLSKVEPVKQSEQDKAQETADKANEQRVKGIEASFSLLAVPEALTLNPDTAFRTEGISNFLDRYWTIESVSINYNRGSLTIEGNCYSPLKNKYVQPDSDSDNSSSDDVKPPALNPGGFINPNPNGTVTSEYGPRGGRTHGGIDIAAGEGTSILASADGVVTYVETSCQVGDSTCGGGWGQHIDLQHADGYLTRYAHLSQVNVQSGQTVSQGDAIGKEGTTGRSTGSHLHFEVIKNGINVDPRTVVNF